MLVLNCKELKSVAGGYSDGAVESNIGSYDSGQGSYDGSSPLPTIDPAGGQLAAALWFLGGVAVTVAVELYNNSESDADRRVAAERHDQQMRGQAELQNTIDAIEARHEAERIRRKIEEAARAAGY